MALYIYSQTQPGQSWTALDLSESSSTGAVFDIKLSISYNQPAMLTFRMIAAAHTLPLSLRNGIIFYDSASQTFNDPLFEGFVEDISPTSESNEVQVTCLDCTRRATSEVQIMSAPWTAGDFTSQTLPSEGSGVVPRLVFNAAIDADDDYSFQRATNRTVGQMIATILDDAYWALHWINAANDDGYSYLSSELYNMLVIPQEKQVFESESIRSGLDRLLTLHPNYRYVWLPGPNNRKFKFLDASVAPQKTLTINDETATYPVMVANVQRSTEGVKTAVKFFGPETTLVQTVSTAGLTQFQRDDLGQGDNSGSLTAYDSEILEQYTDASGTYYAKAYTRFQIADSTKRRSANRLPTQYAAGLGSYNLVFTNSPTLEISLDEGSTWMAISGWWFDAFNGEVHLPNYVYFYRSHPPPGSTQNYYTPTNYRFTHAYYIDPISVRWPTNTSAYSGTGFTVGGIQNTDRIYDEMLAVGYEYGVPVTTAERVEQFRRLANQILKRSRDLVYTGNAVLHGHDYSFKQLNKRVNFSGVDEDGAALTTGWESVNAILTDVEYNFGEGYSTTLTFSSDQMEYLGMDVDAMKRDIGITALQAGFIMNMYIVTHNWYMNKFGGRMRSGTHMIPGDQTLRFDVDRFYYNPLTGSTQSAIGPGSY